MSLFCKCYQLLKVEILSKRFEIAVTRGKKTVFAAVVNGLSQIVKRLVTITLQCTCRGKSVKDVIPFGQELERVSKMVDGGIKITTVQLGNADVVVVIGGPQNGSVLLL